MASDSSDQNKLRLLVDSSTGRVLYSEADKTFVDFFFSLLTMPMGTVIELLCSVKDDNNEVGCLMNIYKSVQELNGNYMLNAAHKDELLHPKVYGNACNGSEFLKIKAAPNVPNANETYYICNRSNYGGTHSASNVRSSYCGCGYQRTYAITIVLEDNTSTNNNVVANVPGYVKETVTFIITDDLQVTPASTISSLLLLNKLNVRDVSKLQERWVVVGYNEAVKLLKAAMTSKHALNEVFGKVPGEGTAKSTATKRW